MCDCGYKMYVFISTVLCMNVVTSLEESDRYLEAPKLISVTAVEPEGLFVEWTVVRYRSRDPVIGYKIRIYEIPENKESDSNERKDMSLQEFNTNDTFPTTREEILEGTITKATIYEIKENILYEVRVIAYKINVDGPPSEPIRIKVLKDKDYNAVISRSTEGCQISVPSGNIILDDVYPYVYNSYF